VRVAQRSDQSGAGSGGVLTVIAWHFLILKEDEQRDARQPLSSQSRTGDQ
jgi:hypothetical protein